MSDLTKPDFEPIRAVLVERLSELPPHLAAFGRSFKELDLDHRYLADNYDEIERAFAGEWIAILDRQVVGHSPKSSELWRNLRRKGLSEKSPLSVFIDPVGSD